MRKEFIQTLDTSQCSDKDRKMLASVLEKLPKAAVSAESVQAVSTKTATEAASKAATAHTVADLKSTSFKVLAKVNVNEYCAYDGCVYRVLDVGSSTTQLMRREHGYETEAVQVPNEEVIQKYTKVTKIQSVVLFKSESLPHNNAELKKQMCINAAQAAIFKHTMAMSNKTDFNMVVELLKDPTDMRVKMPVKKGKLQIQIGYGQPIVFWSTAI
jgi:hypothetical protein